MAMWHEAVLTKETRKEVHATQTHNAGNASTPSLTRRSLGARRPMHRRHHVATPFLATTQTEVEKATEPD